MLSSSIYREHSTALFPEVILTFHSRVLRVCPASSKDCIFWRWVNVIIATKQHANTCRSQHDKASEQTDLARARISLSIYGSLCSPDGTKKSISARPKKNTSTHKQLVRVKHSTLFPISIRYECSRALSRRPLSRTCMSAASGLFSWSMELLAFASRQFAPKIMYFSGRFIHM